MFSELTYAVWYHRVFGKSKKARKALDFYGSFKDFYDAVMCGCDETGFGDTLDMKKVKSFSLLDADILTDECREAYGWDVISEDSEYYPPLLRELPDRPSVLFIDGDKEVLRASVMISVVGSREAMGTAELVARNASYNLAKTGAVIVSGAALGIDSCAHLGAIEAGGKTVAVLGCGLGNDYLKRLGDFYDRLRASGCFITEMLPFSSATRYSFPERNRIISGMSRAVLVSCAAEDSGSLITARLAKKQNRRVYAMASELCYSSGCKMLIDEGAFTFYNAGDIAYPLKEFYPEGTFNELWCNKSVLPSGNDAAVQDMAIPKKKPITRKVNKTVGENNEKEETVKQEASVLSEMPLLSENAKKIYELLGEDTVTMDSLVNASSLKISQVLMGVGELEMKKLIKKLPGSRVQKL